jgi:hypothetical protein
MIKPERHMHMHRKHVLLACHCFSTYLQPCSRGSTPSADILLQARQMYEELFQQAELNMKSLFSSRYSHEWSPWVVLAFQDL